MTTAIAYQPQRDISTVQTGLVLQQLLPAAKSTVEMTPVQTGMLVNISSYPAGKEVLGAFPKYGTQGCILCRPNQI